MINPAKNFNIKPENKLCVLVPDFITKKVYREVVTELCHIAIYTFQKARTYEEGVKLMLDYINVCDKEKIEQQIFECIIYLINTNILIVYDRKPKELSKKFVSKSII